MEAFENLGRVSENVDLKSLFLVFLEIVFSFNLTIKNNYFPLINLLSKWSIH